jgi:hypothetical protein
MAKVLEETMVPLIKLNIPNINWNRIENLIEVTDDNNFIKDINNINKEKLNLFLKKANNEITESYEAMKKKSVSKKIDFNTYLKNSFDETLNEFKYSISYIVDIILSTKKYKGKVSDEKELQVLEIIDTIIQNAESEKPLKKVKNVITNTKPLQNSKIRIISKVPLKFNIITTRQDKLKTPKKPSQMLTRQDKLKTPKKPSQMLTRQDKSKIDKLKLRIEQFKNKEFSPYFEKKINSHINDMDVNIYNIGINRMKSILKDIYEIKK